VEASGAGTTRVRKDPQPSVDRIEALASRILTGDILLPKFQRNFVWERPQIISLLDSVGRGYPIGSVLLWQSKQRLVSENRIADLEISGPRDEYPVNYLLDGQQRLSTICGAMFWRGTDPKSRWNVVYDLRELKFTHIDTLDDPPPHQIRINRIPDPARYFAQVGAFDALDAPDKQQLKDRANALFNRFKDYKIATVTLGDMPIEDVAPIFERINSSGTPLTIVDLMRAATWSPDFDLIDSIEDILAALAAKGFSRIDRKIVLRNLSASAGGGFSSDSIDDLRKHDSDGLKSAVEETRKSYERAVDFLATHIRVASADVVPYSNQLVVLAEIFRRLPTPSAGQYAAIERWFWRTALGGYFSGWNTGSMAADLAAIGAFAEGRSDAVEVPVPEPKSDIWVTRQFRSNNAHSKLLAIVLAHQGPVDLLTGQKIDIDKALAWSNVKEFHHFFPQAYLKREGVPRTRINALANFVMPTSDSNKDISDKKPSDYIPMVEAAVASRGEDLPTWLAANLISEKAFEAAKRDDYAAFLAQRSKTIHEALLPKAGWNSADAKEASVESVTAEVTEEAAEAEAEDAEVTIEDYGRDAIGADEA
jgi:hypothetical protein